MKKVLALSILFSAAAFAESFSGTLVDQMCSSKDNVAEHTKKCAVSCAKGGFGLKTSDGKFMKFDEAGNTKALAALKASTKEKGLTATVTGEADGDGIKVESIALD